MEKKEIEWRHNCLIKLYIFKEIPALAREKVLSNSHFWSYFYNFLKHAMLLLPLKIHSFLQFFKVRYQKMTCIKDNQCKCLGVPSLKKCHFFLSDLIVQKVNRMTSQLFDEIVHFYRKISSFLRKNKIFVELQAKRTLLIAPDFL